jgi:hypothetical protein
MDESDSEQMAVEWRRLCLLRLRRFVRLANTPALQVIPEVRLLTGRAVLSAYRDCVALGMVEEARVAIAEVGAAQPSTTI